MTQRRIPATSATKRGPRAGASASTSPGAAARGDAGPYRIQVAAELCGVPATTLRAWERRYGIPVPRRTAAAYRLYSPEDVALLVRMRDLVAGGTAPAEAARVALATLEANGGRDPEPAADDGIGVAQDRILAAMQRWDATAIDSELTRLAMMLDAQTLFDRLVAPVLREVGRRWEAGEASVAQEHMVSERLELAVRAALRSVDRADGPLVLLACIDHEQHVLGLLGAALRFATNGARTIVLGAMMPPTAVGEAVRSMAPRVVGLSASIDPPSPKALFKAYGKACSRTTWVVGGPAAEGLRDVVEAAGGIVAAGATSTWTHQIRDWLRAPPPRRGT
ncbi:MAG: Transcriptional regulator, MerR family [Labilithrix sp.]|nr:Transcriptional regulator, MerR family [Labilithrix sp.]